MRSAVAASSAFLAARAFASRSLRPSSAPETASLPPVCVTPVPGQVQVQFHGGATLSFQTGVSQLVEGAQGLPLGRGGTDRVGRKALGLHVTVGDAVGPLLGLVAHELDAGPSARALDDVGGDAHLAEARHPPGGGLPQCVVFLRGQPEGPHGPWIDAVGAGLGRVGHQHGVDGAWIHDRRGLLSEQIVGRTAVR